MIFNENIFRKVINSDILLVIVCISVKPRVDEREIVGQKLTELSQGCKENVTLLKGGKSLGEVANYNIPMWKMKFTLLSIVIYIMIYKEIVKISFLWKLYKKFFQYGGTNILYALAGKIHVPVDFLAFK